MTIVTVFVITKPGKSVIVMEMRTLITGVKKRRGVYDYVGVA